MLEETLLGYALVSLYARELYLYWLQQLGSSPCGDRH
jgi:hypothetical protein